MNIVDNTLSGAVYRAQANGGQVLLHRDDLAVVRYGSTSSDWFAAKSAAGRAGWAIFSLVVNLTLTVVTVGLWLIPWGLWWLATARSHKRDTREWEAYMNRLKEDRFRVIELTAGDNGGIFVKELQGAELKYAINYFDIDPRTKVAW